MIDDRVCMSRGITDALLDLVVASSEAGSGVPDFLAGLAVLAERHLARPERPVSCSITLVQRKRFPVDVGSRAAGAVPRMRVPLAMENGDSAVLELFAPGGDAFSSDDAEAAQAFAEEAARCLLLVLRLARLTEWRDDLDAAMQSRTVIDLAIGAIMAQNRCNRAAAFKILRNTSNNRNLKIRDVAASLVSSIAGDDDISAHFDE